ncbi:MAG: hypothetical protein F6K65_28275 [Moorea sp. SIO3C2]|nr:hypothetical protein [Moorena sp. SIO3C2]
MVAINLLGSAVINWIEPYSKLVEALAVKSLSSDLLDIVIEDERYPTPNAKGEQHFGMREFRMREFRIKHSAEGAMK